MEGREKESFDFYRANLNKKIREARDLISIEESVGTEPKGMEIFSLKQIRQDYLIKLLNALVCGLEKDNQALKLEIEALKREISNLEGERS